MTFGEVRDKLDKSNVGRRKYWPKSYFIYKEGGRCFPLADYRHEGAIK